ncbi:MAG: hypothetical protein ABSG27_11860 [Candidatus Acidiferrales bacterium]
MRVLLTCIVALGLVAAPAMAGNGTNNDSAANGATNTPAPGTSAAKADPAAASPSSLELESELQQLRDLVGAQAKQLQEQQERVQTLQEQLNASNPLSDSPAVDPLAAPGSIGPVSGALAGGADSAQGAKSDEPTALHYKGITLTPGGFMAAEAVWRQKALASDVNTPFNSVPFEGSSNAHMSEFQASARQSRISMLVEGKLDNVKIGGYYETDFLSAGVTSNNNQSNSYTLRQRQFFGQAAFNSGWTFTGGQQWSLITETTKGMDNRTEALPQVIDAQYVSGFSWARQLGFRVTKNFNNKFWLGASIEEGQDTLTAHGFPTATCAPANPQVTGSLGACSASGLNGTLVFVPKGTPTAPTTGTAAVNATSVNDFLLGAFGTSGGLYNPLGNYAYNETPDFVIKAVAEPGFGHYELFGLVTVFRDRVFPCVVAGANLSGCGAAPQASLSAANAFNDSRTGGGIGANARWNFLQKKVDVGVHFFGGSGIGRYGSAGLSDLTIRSTGSTSPLVEAATDGTLAVIRNYQALGTIQLHPTPKLDINFYAGGEYDARTAYLKSGGTVNAAGYGAQGFANYGCNTEVLPFAAQSTSASTGVPTGVAGSNGFIPGALQNCEGDTRNLIEGTVSFWYRFYKGSKGTFQYGMQYSNFIRNTWNSTTGATGTGADGITHVTNGGPHADENMVFTSFRYVLP